MLKVRTWLAPSCSLRYANVIITASSKSESSGANNSRASRDERQSPPKVSAAPPPVKDEVSWPTPDTAPLQDKERKQASEKQADDKDDETADSGKPRKKPEWKPMAVVPNILWETQSMREKTSRSGYGNGETRSRGGANSRGGRGGFRGSANGVSPRQEGGEHSARRGRADASEESTSSTKPQRASSASALVDRSQQQRTSRQQSLAEAGKSASQQTKDVNGVPESKHAASQRSNKTSKTLDVAEQQEDERVPEPIPRRNSQGTQTEPQLNGVEATSRSEDSARALPAENRKDVRNGESGRDFATRGAKRGGRGRGGSREFVNGHHNGHAFVNGTSPADLSGAVPFGVPQSPSFQTSRGNHQGAFSGSGRGGWRNNPRAQSIPMEGYYARYPYPTHVQTYGPGMYDYGVPMSAVPYSPMMDPNYLFAIVSQQLEYYFSVDNLLKDTFLRRNMDSQGFVYLDVIAAFNRIKSVTQDRELLKQVCLQSETVEIRIGEDGKERLRRCRDWEKFIMPMEDRFPAARFEGPQHLERPEQRMPNIYGPMQVNTHGGAGYPMYPPRPNDRRSYDSSFAMMNGAARGAFFPEQGSAEMNGEEMRGRATKSPAQTRNGHPAALDGSTESVAEPDVFPDQNIEQLTVCVKMSARRVPYHTAASRTFSDGSIDTRTIAGEMVKSDSQATPAVNGEKPTTNGLPAQSDSRINSPNGQHSPERSATDVSVFWVRDLDQPMGNLPSDLVPEPYVQLRLKALEQRGQAATGTCPYDLEVLYQFWSHFLIRNFNNRMYREFKYYAEADTSERHSFSGKTSLLKYYGQALSSTYPIPTCVLNDYIATVKSEGAKSDGAAFKQLRQAWRNGALNLRNRKKLAEAVDDSLKALLEA